MIVSDDAGILHLKSLKRTETVLDSIRQAQVSGFPLHSQCNGFSAGHHPRPDDISSTLVVHFVKFILIDSNQMYYYKK